MGYINRATVNFVVNQLVTSPGVGKESIDLALRFIRQLRGTGTLPNSFTFARLYPAVQNSTGTPAQRKLVDTFIKEAALDSVQLAQAQSLQEQIEHMNAEQLQESLSK